MDPKENIILSETQIAGRLSSFGKVSSLPFRLGPQPAVFTICLVAKEADNFKVVEIVSLRGAKMKTAKQTVIRLNDFAPHLIQEIPVGAIDLTKYDVYWASHLYQE